MMNIRIPIKQIPIFWDHIKFVALETDNVKEQYYQSYCNNLLIKLLCDKVIPVVRLDEDRNIIAMAIFEYSYSNVTKVKTLEWKHFYSWKNQSVEEWTEAFETIKKFALEEECKFINAVTYNERVWQLAEEVGFKETSRQYLLEV